MPEELEIGLEAIGQIKVLYTGDLHANVEKMKYMSTVIKGSRGSSLDTLLLDSGDWSKGSAISDKFAGKPMAEIINYLRYDALALGEEDLSWGIRGLKKLAKITAIPFLCCNLKGERPEFIEPFIIKEIGKIKVAVVGVSPVLKLPERHYTLIEPEKAIESTLGAIKKEAADIIILLSHLGIEHDRKIAALFPSINLIIGGHSHIRTEAPEQAGSTLIVHSGAFGEYLGSIALDVGTVLTLKSKE
jgi:2',3'-cyclic-nucleotide 2'-phosphodiesterase (5'-nucleotidase family)